MANVLEFFVKMKDMMSGGLVRMAATSQSAFNRVQSHINATTAANNRLANSVDDVSRRMERSGNSAAGWAKKIAVAAAATGMLSFATSSIKAAMNYGATQKSFEVLTGSPSTGKALSSDLNKLQQNTILGPEVFKNAQTMMGFGVTADKVLPSLRMLGDVSMGNAEKLGSLTLAFSQVTAAGKLTGQDLLQFVNAGFNPLKEISDKTGVSMGELKKQTEKGGISAAMVEDAFKSATSAGGKFNGMMGQIAETSYGRLQILEGQFENFKIGVGEALMPVAESLMEVASRTIEWLGITKTAPQILMAESAGIRGLVGMITTLNEGNDTRRMMIEKLIAKYPEFFGNIDKEKILNSELLERVQAVNAAYQDRIKIASSQLLSDTNAKLASEAMSEYVRLQAISDAYRRGDVAAAESMQKFGEGLTTKKAFQNNADAFGAKATRAKADFESANAVKQQADRQLGFQKAASGFSELLTMMKTPGKMAEVFKGRNEDFAAFEALRKNPMANLTAMQELVNKTGAAGIKSNLPANTNNTIGSKAAGDSVRGIAGGGPRNITINGVKFADNINIDGSNGKDPMVNFESKLQEMFLRVLNSGAAVN